MSSRGAGSLLGGAWLLCGGCVPLASPFVVWGLLFVVECDVLWRRG
nr:MAG TPA: hypothetical protein [Caudoviricetes sp.]